jgi:hypothetical protein
MHFSVTRLSGESLENETDNAATLRLKGESARIRPLSVNFGFSHSAARLHVIHGDSRSIPVLNTGQYHREQEIPRLSLGDLNTLPADLRVVIKDHFSLSRIVT